MNSPGRGRKESPLPFGHQHALDFSQRAVRVARQLERVRQHDEIEAAFGKRQRIAMRKHGRGARGMAGVERHPAVRHAVGAQGIELRQADLQRMKTEDVADHAVELRLLPGQQVLAGRRFEPGGQRFDAGSGVRHSLATNGLRRWK
jgi:hypothetical protein